MPTRYWNTPSLPMNVLLVSVAVLLFSWGAVGSAHAQTVYHVTETGDASNDGSSFANEDALSLQGALSNATGDDVIVIAAGRYLPTDDENDRDARFEITGAQDGLKIYGGWSGVESFTGINDVENQLASRDLATNPVVLSGDIDNNDNTNTSGITEDAADINGDNIYNVVYLNGRSGGNITTDTVLDGLVITGGQASGHTFETARGGGVFCDGNLSGNICNPIISNIRFIGNSANINGGAIFNSGASGGESSPQITNATFTGNSADRGGAIYNNGFNGKSRPQITNVTITGNSADVRGGAIFNDGNINDPDETGESSPQITNSILWGNNANTSGDEIFNSAGEATLSYTLIEGGVDGPGVGGGTNVDGGNNLGSNANPDFVNVNDPAGNGLLLLTSSPALDAGDNTPFETGGIAEDIETDLLGEARIQNGTVSVGAYERGINNEAQLRLVARSGVETGTFELSNTGIGVSGAEVDLGNLPPGVSAIDDSGDGDVNSDGDTWTVDVLAGGTATVRIDYERGASADPGLLNLTAELNTNSYTVDDGGVDGTDPSDAIVDWALLEAPYGSSTALSFDGTDDYLRMDGSAEDVGLVGASFTVEAWIRIDDLTGDNPILGHGDSSPGANQVLHLTTRGSTLHMGFFSNDLEGSASLEEERWHHAAFVYDAANEEQRIYLDGELDGTRSADAFAGDQSDQLQIGRWGGSRYLDGALDELRIWNDARGEDQIQATMHQTISTDMPGLVTSYRFDAAQTEQRFDADHDGTTAYDLASGRNASFEGDPQWTDSGAPLGQESIVVAPGTAGTIGADGQSLTATVTSTTDRLTLYRYGDADAAVVSHDALPGLSAERANLVWGALNTTSGSNVSADLELTYGDVTVPSPGEISLLGRSGPEADWTSRNADGDITATTATLSDQTSFGEYGLSVPSIYYVDAEGNGEDNDGTSFDDAFTNMEDALNKANGDDIIVVAAGTYVPTGDASDRDARFEITGDQDGLNIYGGFSGSELFDERSDVEAALDTRDLAENETILSGNIDDDDSANTENSYNVVVIRATSNSITANTVMDGFTIRDGNANDDQADAGDSSDAGGGIHLASLTNDARPTLRNLRITQNSAINGGGVYIDSFLGTAAPFLSNVIVTENEAEEGGGLYATASTGGITAPVWVNAVFASNAANQRGGAFYKRAIAGGTVTSQVVNAHVVNNQATDDGGVAYHEGVNTDATMAPSYVNTLFWNNTSDPFGAEIDDPGSGVPSFQHVLAEGGCPGGDATCDTVLDDDPKLVGIENPGGQDGQIGTQTDGLRFASNAPLTDAGTNTPFEGSGVAATITTDLLGDDRIQQGTVNIGAYESTLHSGPIFYVKADATGAGDGSSFDDALRSPAPALRLARAGDVIAIAEGVYTPITPADPSNITESERATPFLIDADNEGIEVYGGWSGTQTFADPDAVRAELSSRDLTNTRTVLSGDISGSSTTGSDGIIEDPDDTADTNSHNVLLLDGRNAPDGITPATVVDGVVLTGGNLSGTGGDGTLRLGAGLFCNGGDNPCAPRLSNLLLIGNEGSSQPGGGLGIASEADDPTPQAHLTDIVVTRNNSQFGGGGIAIFGSASPTITNAVISANTGGFFGGGGAIIASDVGRSAPSFVNTTFTGNIAPNLGSAVLSLTDGDGEVDLTLTNSVLWGNAGLDGSINQIRNQNNTTVRLQNTLMQEATGDGIVNEDGGTALFLDADGYAVDFGQSTNLDADPLFADTDAGDVRLTGGSPAIARGTFAPFESGGIADGITTDIAGDNRLFGAKPDLGAFTFNDIATTDDDIADAAGLLGYLEPTGFEGLVLLRENSAANGGLAFERIDEQPEDPNSELEGNVAPFTWTVTSSLDNAPSYDLLLSTADLGGISDFDALTLYKSEDGGQTWDAVDTFTGASLVLDEDRALVAVQDLTGFSQFAIASSAADNPLPVELAGFEAALNGESAMLQWQTLSETNNAGFEVQRAVGSVNGSVMETSGSDVSTWQTLATLNGAGTTDEPQSYRFEDTQLPYAADSLSYRLRQLDTDGTESFSEAVVVARQVNQAELLPTYPNPVRGQATVRFAVPERQVVRIDLYDVLGRRVQTVVDGEQDGRTEQMLDVSRLSSGTYFLRMQTPGHTETQRVTVVR